jgi:YidC/Oxa1 family membrane protein insertase
VGSIGAFFGQLFAPITQIFHYVFYLPIYNVLMLLYQGVHAMAPALPAYAIAIFFLTVIIRLCLFPLTRKQLQSSRKMQELQPQLQELQKRHRGNPQELMAAQQALYREHGVSMYGGCLPLLIQMPFLYGLYFSLYTALLPNRAESIAGHLARVNRDIYPFLPHLAALPSTHFLWTNLAAADPWKVLPVLAGLLTFLQLRMAMPVRKPTSGAKQSDPNSQVMGSMQFVMPFFTFFMALNFPSGLAFYWAISTAFSAVQQYFLSGWGSLFVGIPGMEHLVPAPTTPALPPATRAQSAFVDSSPRDARPTGIAGLRQLLADMASNRTQQAQEKAPPDDESPPANGSAGKLAKKSGGSGAGDGAELAKGSAASNGTSRAQPVSAAKDASGDVDGSARRNRAARQGPTLVKPGVSSTSPAEGMSGQPPSTHGASSNGLKSLNGASRSTATGSANGAVGAAPKSAERGASGAGARPQRPPQTSSQRGTSGGGAARKRPSGKSKGGR